MLLARLLRNESSREIGLPPNQSLKLTEPAVDDFRRAPKNIFKEMAMPAARIVYH